MVGSRVHGAAAVVAWWKTGIDGGLEAAIAITIIVDSLEESKEFWVWSIAQDVSKRLEE